MWFSTDIEEAAAEIGRVIGKREMLWSIQLQIRGAREQCHEVDIDKIISAMNVMLNVEEQIWDSKSHMGEVETDMYKSSLAMLEK
jgi:hypothetical protein